MKPKRLKELEALASSFTAEEFAELINLRLSDFECYLGLAGMTCVTVKLESANPNGGIIQLNVPAFGPDGWKACLPLPVDGAQVFSYRLPVDTANSSDPPQ